MSPRLACWFCLFNFKVDIAEIAVVVDIFVLVEPDADRSSFGITTKCISAWRRGYPGEPVTHEAIMTIEIMNFFTVIWLVLLAVNPKDNVGFVFYGRTEYFYGCEAEIPDFVTDIQKNFCAIGKMYRLFTCIIHNDAVALIMKELEFIQVAQLLFLLTS